MPSAAVLISRTAAASLPQGTRPIVTISPQQHTSFSHSETEKPTNAPAPPPTDPPAPAPPTNGQPTFSNEEVSPPWWPCTEGQIKGNRDSKKYHVPGGQFYAKTYEGVECFDSEAAAQAAGYVRSKR